MRIHILGTAAAEGWPAVFCGCETCERARAAGGKNIRTRQSVLIDDILKIDLGPDTHCQQAQHGVRLSQLKHLFFTHTHNDHFAIRELEYLCEPFAHNRVDVPLRVYGSPEAVAQIDALDFRNEIPVETVALEPFREVQAGHLAVTPIPGSHKRDELCLTYVVQSDSAIVLFAWDTGLYSEESLQWLAKRQFDLLVIECTQGTHDIPSRSHMGLDGVLQTRDRLVAGGLTQPDVRTIITHFSHNIGMLHDELEAIVRPHGIEVAWDGMVVEC